MNAIRFEEIVECWQRQPVLVVGDILIDKHIYCQPHKLSQEAPIQILKQRYINIKPGGAANVAMMCAALGAQVSLFGRVWMPDETPEETHLMFEELGDARVDVDGVFYDGSMLCTPLKTRVWAAIDEDYQQMLRIDEESTTAMHKSTAEILVEASRCVTYEDARTVIVSDYDKGFCTIDLLKALPTPKREMALYVDPPNRLGWIDYYKQHCPGKPVFVPNRKKAFGLDAEGLATATGCCVVVTQGSEGCSFSTPRGGVMSHIPTVQRHPADVTGCGDQFMAVFAMTQISHGLPTACMMANVAAGLQAIRIGCTPVTVPELQKELFRK